MPLVTGKLFLPHDVNAMQVGWTYATVFLLICLPAFTADTNSLQPTRYQGFGSKTLGGTGQSVYRVTSLSDSGPESLRDGLSKGNRHIVFDVGGEISLARDIFIQGANITIDGLTAPSPGITLRNNGLVISGNRGAHDVIVRGIRIRGAGSGVDKRIRDGINISRGAYNVVIDRVSIHGSEDGNLDITDSHDVTVSWSIFAEPAGAGKSMLIKYNPARITLHHNLFVKGIQRNPHVRIDDAGTAATDTTVDMRNNVVWNWRGGYGTQILYGPWANIVNNFYSNPGASMNDKRQAIIVCTGKCDGNSASVAKAYVSGNYSADGINLNAKGTEKAPFPAPPVDTTDACIATSQVLSDAGVKPRDVVDQRYLAAILLPSCTGLKAPSAVSR